MKLFFAKEEEKEGLIDAMVADDGQWPAFLKTLSDKCLGDSKFICGDNLTIADFVVGGWFTNVVFNPNRKTPKFNEAYEKHAPERLKTYNNDFATAMEDYLTARAQNHKCTMCV